MICYEVLYRVRVGLDFIYGNPIFSGYGFSAMIETFLQLLLAWVVWAWSIEIYQHYKAKPCLHPNQAIYHSRRVKVCIDCRKIFEMADGNIKHQR